MNTDVLIIGSGVAGLYTALNIDEKTQVLIITKKEVNYCNSFLAQGGISVAQGEGDFKAFFEDTCEAGGKQNNAEAVDILVKESRENVNLLMEFGVKFDKKNGELHYTREAAHRINRILHCQDRTGAMVHDTLYKKCLERNNINFIENCPMEDLIIEDDKCFGILANRNGKQEAFLAKAVIMATGGIGGLFRSTTNKTAIQGEGMEIALKYGIAMKDMDKIQFHPTVLYEKGKQQRFLISESVRGEGGILMNHKGERFVDELLPRDKVTMAIYEELKHSGEEHVFLDMRHLDKEFIIKRFPGINEECLKRGIDITKDLIPVLPAQHYMMGGIAVDTSCKTSVKNLYAVGEVSCTGVHGNNRLASNSLLESLVFSRRAAMDINENIDQKNNNSQWKENKKRTGISHKQNELLKETILSLRGDLEDELCNH